MRFAYPALCAVAGALLLYLLTPSPEPEYRDVQVPVEVLVASEPDTVIQWRERIVYRTVERETRATAPLGAATDVAAFCAVGVTEPPDTVFLPSPVPDRVPALVRSGAYDGRTLKLWEAQADGDLALETFRVRSPWRFTMSDSAFVQGSRWWWIDDAVKAAAFLGVGYLIGRF